jgi:hypothetical protein
MIIPTPDDLRAAFQAALSTTDTTDPAAVIRAAVEVVLPEEKERCALDFANDFHLDLELAANRFLKYCERRYTRAQFLALADALQPWEEQADG